MTAFRITDIDPLAGTAGYDCANAFDTIAARMYAGNECHLPAGEYLTSRQVAFTTNWLGKTERPWLFGGCRSS